MCEENLKGWIRLYCPFCRHWLSNLLRPVSVTQEHHCRWCGCTVYHEIQLREGRILIHVHAERRNRVPAQSGEREGSLSAPSPHCLCPPVSVE